MNDEKYAIDIVWSTRAAGDLPDLVGPFDTAEEAAEWARLNVTQGNPALVRRLTWPYLRSER